MAEAETGAAAVLDASALLTHLNGGREALPVVIGRSAQGGRFGGHARRAVERVERPADRHRHATPYSFLSMTKRSPYSEEEARPEICVSERKYLFLYPMVKQRRWAYLSFEPKLLKAALSAGRLRATRRDQPMSGLFRVFREGRYTVWDASHHAQHNRRLRRANCPS